VSRNQCAHLLLLLSVPVVAEKAQKPQTSVPSLTDFFDEKQVTHKHSILLQGSLSHQIAIVTATSKSGRCRYTPPFAGIAYLF
jgi:hypothetical protein